MNDGTVNTQIIDALSTTITLLTGAARAQSMSMLDAVAAETLGLAMHAAVSRQNQASIISSAAVTAACARMLQVRETAPPSIKPKGRSSDATSAPHIDDTTTVQSRTEKGTDDPSRPSSGATRDVASNRATIGET